MTLKEACRRRQHGADHECGHDRQEERLGDVENGDDANQQQRDKREGDDFGTTNDRGQFDVAVRQWRADRVVWLRTFVGQDTQQALPALRRT